MVPLCPVPFQVLYLSIRDILCMPVGFADFYIMCCRLFIGNCYLQWYMYTANICFVCMWCNEATCVCLCVLEIRVYIYCNHIISWELNYILDLVFLPAKNIEMTFISFSIFSLGWNLYINHVSVLKLYSYWFVQKCSILGYVLRLIGQ